MYHVPHGFVLLCALPHEFLSLLFAASVWDFCSLPDLCSWRQALLSSAVRCQQVLMLFTASLGRKQRFAPFIFPLAPADAGLLSAAVKQGAEIAPFLFISPIQSERCPSSLPLAWPIIAACVPYSLGVGFEEPTSSVLVRHRKNISRLLPGQSMGQQLE